MNFSPPPPPFLPPSFSPVQFYLQLRLDLSFSYLLKPLFQLILVMLASFCCVSRITDHKHFVSDIAAGAVIGSIFAWITVGAWVSFKDCHCCSLTRLLCWKMCHSKMGILIIFFFLHVRKSISIE